MPRERDKKGRFTKQNPPKIQPPIGAGPSGLITPVAGRPTLEELEEKQRSKQILNLIERQTLLAYEVKRKKTPKKTAFIERQKETRKLIVKKLEQPILEQIEKVEETPIQPLIETLQTIEKKMTEEGEGSNIPIMTSK